jgi:hypothetical protein
VLAIWVDYRGPQLQDACMTWITEAIRNSELPGTMRAKIGNIVEIGTPSGLAYALYTHRNAEFGAMLRLFDILHASRPSSCETLVKDAVRFTTFYPLQPAVNRGFVQIIGNVSVPEDLRAFPLFRAAGLIDPQTRRATSWWLWDGTEEWRIGDLTPEQRKLPIRSIWNHAFLVDRIVEGWRPETDRL